MGNLSPEEFDRLSSVLSKSIDFPDLEQCVWQATGDRLFIEYVGIGKPLKLTIRELITALENDGTTARLADVIYRRKKFNFDLRNVLTELFPGVERSCDESRPFFDRQSGGIPQADNIPKTAPGLQRFIRPQLKYTNIREWNEKILCLSRQVCRIEFDQTGIGTGFLVENGRVLTNWHVLEEIRKLGGADRIQVRFDYHAGPDGIDPGQIFDVINVVDELPCAPGELIGQIDARPEPDHLDYALLALGGSTVDRGFIRLKSSPPVGKGDPIIIVQHPRAATMKLALDDDAVIGLENEGRRLRYRTNTEPGSSGSPCFNWDLDLVALHHLGDPALFNPKYNQGIPIDLIIASLSQRAPGEFAKG